MADKFKREQLGDEAFEDVEFDPFISPDEIRQKSSDEFRKSHDEHMQMLGQCLQHIAQSLDLLHHHLSTPKRIVRDQQGRALGIEPLSGGTQH